MKIKYIVIFIGSLIIHINYLCAQNLKFVHSPEDGLSNNTVWRFIQDELGFIWIATEDGINKYDGYKFVKFKYNPDDSNTVSDNKIYDIIQDKSGILWIATAYGLNSYNPKFNRFKRYIKTELSINAPSDNTIRCLLEDDDNLLWIGTDNGGLNTFNLKTRQFYSYYNPNGSNAFNVESITALYKSRDGNIWIGSKNNGLFEFNKTSSSFKHYYFKHKDKGYQDMKNWITAIYEDSNNIFWIGSRGGGLTRLNRDKNQISDFTGLYNYNEPSLRDQFWIWAMLEDNHDQLWIATKNGLTKLNQDKSGLSFYERTDDNNIYSINSNYLTTLFLDASGSLWIGNFDAGFDIVHNTIVNFSHYKRNENEENTLPGNIVLALQEDEYGGILIGTYAGGLSLLDRRTSKIIHYFEQYKELNKPVLKIHIDKHGIIWLGTWGKGLQSINRKNNLFETYMYDPDDYTTISNATAISIYEDNNNNLWIGTFNGLNKFNKKTKKFEHFFEDDGLPSNVMHYVTGNGSDTLWIGTRGGGLSIFDLKSKTFENFLFNESDSTTISNNVINYIYNDNKGNLWITTDVGLNRFDKKTKKFTRITEADGLPINRLWGILEDKKGNLWISSNDGICKYTPDPTNNTKGTFRNFSKADGLQSNEFTQPAHYHNLKTDEMFFGGVNGFNSFFPDRIIENQFVPPVRLTSFEKMDVEAKFKGDTTINFKKDIQVSWKENFISFEFAGLNYREPEKNLYSYKMEGLDRNWSNPSNRRYASYPNISDGEYVFRVRAVNNEGIWNEEGLSVNVTINPPFWRTRWFISLSIIVIILSVILYIRLRTKRLEHEKRILEEIVALRTAELRQKNEDITASIQYAKRIQIAILPTFSAFYNEFPDSFILYKPKDIVSGDFFWFYKAGKRRLFAAADCTGHGVPGAFMSIIGNNLLEKIVTNKKILDPAEILTQLDKDIIEALDQRGRKGDSFDGMDIALCALDEGSNILEYAGAYRPLIHISGRTAKKIKSTKRTIGGAQKIEIKPFVTHKIELKKGDIVYAFSDGFADQFGGPLGRKFMMKNLQYELANIHYFPMNEQRDYLDETVEIWMNNYNLKYEQVDDILIVGVQF